MPPIRRDRVCVFLALAFASGCNGSESTAPSGAPAVVLEKEGLTKTDTGWLFHTPNFSLEPGQERFLCYAVTTPEDLSIGRFSSDARPYIHHFLFSTALTPEEEGLTECNVLFKPTWSPMYIDTTASADVRMPVGAAKLVDKNSQLVLQLHLLNASSQKVTGDAAIRMDASHETNPEPVGIFAFGTTNIHLPPQQTTTVEGSCTVSSDARLFSMMPHMHYLGRRLEIDLGPDDNNLKPVYVSDPYDFNEQKIEPFDLDVAAGTHSRIRCTYDNTRDKTIGFGESSLTEMCFGIGFTVGVKGPRGCLAKVEGPDGGVPRALDAGVCGAKEYSGGIGRACTSNGGECDKTLFCSANAPGGGDAGSGKRGVCMKIGCSTSDDCGGATCCTPSVGGGLIQICVPEACRDPSCIPLH